MRLAPRFPIDERRIAERRLHGVGDVAAQLDVTRRLAARFTALRDMANRQQTDRLRQGLAAERTGELDAADD